MVPGSDTPWLRCHRCHSSSYHMKRGRDGVKVGVIMCDDGLSGRRGFLCFAEASVHGAGVRLVIS